MKPTDQFTEEDKDVHVFIFLRMGHDSLHRLAASVGTERRDPVMFDACNLGVKITKVIHFPMAGRRYETFNRQFVRSTPRLEGKTGLRIVKPWEPFEEG